MRISGALLLFLAALAFGACSAASLYERVRLLLSLRTLLRSMRRELCVSLPELRQLFSQDKDELTKPLTDIMSASLDEGCTPYECARSAFSSKYARRLLGENERNDLINVFANVGEGALENAEELLKNAEDELTVCIDEARESAKTGARVRLALSVYAGLAAAILIL